MHNTISQLNKLAKSYTYFWFSTRILNTVLNFIFRFIKYCCTVVFSLALSAFVLSFISIYFDLNILPFWLFFFIFIFNYYIGSRLVAHCWSIGWYNIGFHVFFIFIGLNFVDLFLVSNDFGFNRTLYFLFSFVYAFLILSSYYLGFRASKVFVFLAVCYSIFIFINEFENFLVISHILVYKALRLFKYYGRKKSTQKYKKLHYMFIPPVASAQRVVRLYYKHFGDTLFLWDQGVLVYAWFYLIASLIVYIISVSVYFRYVQNFFNSKFAFYLAYLVAGPVVISFILYMVSIYWLGWEFNYIIINAKAVYSVIRTYSFQHNPVFYRALILYFIFFFILAYNLNKIARIIMGAATGKQYAVDTDYIFVKRVVYGRQSYPTFWKFPSAWVKRIFDDISRRYRSRSTTLDMPEDANFYYGGPNPNKVLFDHYTGEGKPIFYRDFLNENYRIYYRLYRFASQKYPSSILFFKERSWVLQIFEEDTPSAKRFLLSPGPSYLYSFKRLSFDYQLNLIITYDDVARDKLGNEVEDFYDTHVWEHVWRKGFGRRAPAPDYASTPGLFSEMPDAYDPQAPKMESRDPYLLHMVTRNTRLRKQLSSVDRSLDLSTGFKVKNRIGPMVVNNDMVKFSGFRYLLNQVITSNRPDFVDELHGIHLNTTVKQLIFGIQDWFFRNRAPSVRRLTMYRDQARFFSKADFKPRYSTWNRIVSILVLDNAIKNILNSSLSEVVEDEEFSKVFSVVYRSLGIYSDFSNLFHVGSKRSNFGFLNRLIRYGFFSTAPLKQYSPKRRIIESPIPESELDVGFGCNYFSKFSTYNYQIDYVFSNFPPYAYLSRWKLMFSGFFENEGKERFADLSRGRTSRFRFVNPEIIVKNETGAKINDYFINLSNFLSKDNPVAHSISDIIRLLSRYRLISRSSIFGSISYDKHKVNMDVLNRVFRSNRIDRIYSNGSKFYKLGMVDTNIVEPDPREIRSSYERRYERLPLTTYEYNSLINRPDYIGGFRRSVKGSSVYGSDFPVRYTLGSNLNLYLNSYIHTTFFSQFFTNASENNYFTNFSFNAVRVEKFKPALFFEAFNQQFSNNVFNSTSLSSSIFINANIGYISHTQSYTFFMFRGVLNKTFQNYYRVQDNFFKFSNNRFKFYVNPAYKFSVKDANNSKINRDFISTIGFADKIIGSFYYSRNAGSGYIRLNNWINYWSIRLFWGLKNKERYEYSSLTFNVRTNESFFDRMDTLRMASDALEILDVSEDFSSIFVFVDEEVCRKLLD